MHVERLETPCFIQVANSDYPRAVIIYYSNDIKFNIIYFSTFFSTFIVYYKLEVFNIRMVRIFLTISIVINVLVIGCVFYLKKDVLITKVEDIKYNMFYSKYESKESLKTMNNTTEPNEITEVINIGSSDTFKILIIGNSLAYHPMDLNIGWDHSGGMAASTKENDYAHLLLKHISKKYHNKNIEMKIINLAKFEREFNTFKYNDTFSPDVAIFQLGENVSLNNNKDEFKNSYIQLINTIRSTNNPLILCTSTFLPSLEKTDVIKSVCIETNSLFVDLSHLTLLDKSNYSYSEKQWNNKGIGVHPGDNGMKNIANQLFTAINGALR